MNTKNRNFSPPTKTQEYLKITQFITFDSFFDIAFVFQGMSMLKTKSLHGRAFLGGYLILFPLLFIVTLIFTREEIHIFTNAYHSAFFDGLMKYWTYLGDGVVLIIFILIMVFISFRHFFILLAAYLISGIDTQLMKRLFFNNLARPAKYFEIHDIDYQLYLVPDVQQHAWHSFPSGHASAAFAVFFGLFLLIRSKWLQMLCFILALGVAYSRIYLSQHFLMDVVAGSVMGVLSAWLAWLWLKRYQASWLDKPLVNLMRR